MPEASADRSHTVQMFWHGPALSRMEQLAIASFLHHGHPVDLHVYEEPRGVPRGACVRDAAEILPRDALFTHRRTGSVAIFADWFRSVFSLNSATQGGSGLRRNGMIEKRHNGVPVISFAFYGAWIKSSKFTDLEAGSTGLFKQTIVLEHEGLERVV